MERVLYETELIPTIWSFIISRQQICRLNHQNPKYDTVRFVGKPQWHGASRVVVVGLLIHKVNQREKCKATRVQMIEGINRGV
jgi:hypothetical protein